MYFRSNFFFFEKKYPSERVIIPRIGTEDEKKILILLLRKENNGHGNITSLNDYDFTRLLRNDRSRVSKTILHSREKSFARAGETSLQELSLRIVPY